MSSKGEVLGQYPSKKCEYFKNDTCVLTEYLKKIVPQNDVDSSGIDMVAGNAIDNPNENIKKCPIHEKMKFSSNWKLGKMKVGFLYSTSEKYHVIYEYKEVSGRSFLQIMIEGPFIHGSPVCYITAKYQGEQDLGKKILEHYNEVGIIQKTKNKK